MLLMVVLSSGKTMKDWSRFLPPVLMWYSLWAALTDRYACIKCCAWGRTASGKEWGIRCFVQDFCQKPLPQGSHFLAKTPPLPNLRKFVNLRPLSEQGAKTLLRVNLSLLFYNVLTFKCFVSSPTVRCIAILLHFREWQYPCRIHDQVVRRCNVFTIVVLIVVGGGYVSSKVLASSFLWST